MRKLNAQAICDAGDRCRPCRFSKKMRKQYGLPDKCPAGWTKRNHPRPVPMPRPAVGPERLEAPHLLHNPGYQKMLKAVKATKSRESRNRRTNSNEGRPEQPLSDTKRCPYAVGTCCGQPSACSLSGDDCHADPRDINSCEDALKART